jgi:predicted metal-binding protein
MANSLKSYPPTWDGDLLLACRKCQKKLKGEPGMRALAKLKKTIKRHNKEHSGAKLHLINVPCMDMCPKSAVTICLPSAQTARLSILHNEDEIDELYRERSTKKQMQDMRCSPLY